MEVYISNPSAIEACTKFMKDDFKKLTQDELNILYLNNLLLGKSLAYSDHEHKC